MNPCWTFRLRALWYFFGIFQKYSMAYSIFQNFDILLVVLLFGIICKYSIFQNFHIFLWYYFFWILHIPKNWNIQYFIKQNVVWKKWNILYWEAFRIPENANLSCNNIFFNIMEYDIFLSFIFRRIFHIQKNNRCNRVQSLTRILYTIFWEVRYGTYSRYTCFSEH